MYALMDNAAALFPRRVSAYNARDLVVDLFCGGVMV
jgi:hypothetical protein